MIVFKQIRYKNILSTGNSFQKYDLDDKGCSIIVGENGSGKSTIIDALSFVLFGKAFRNVNKNQLINSINEKDLSVELDFSIGKDLYTVKRTIKPNSFLIYKNSQLIEVDSTAIQYQKMLEKDILKMNFKTFSQVVVLGSCNYIPFMQLSAKDRRDVVEELLDLQIFSTMNVFCKEDLAAVTDKIRSLESEIEKTNDFYIHALQNNKKISESSDNVKRGILENIQKLSIQKTSVLDKIKSLQDDVVSDDLLNQSLLDVGKKLNEISSIITKLSMKYDDSNNNINFFESNDWCITCGQDISAEYKEIVVEKLKKDSSEFGSSVDLLKPKQKKFENSKRDVLEKIEQNKEIIREISALKKAVDSINSQISSYEKQIEDIDNAKNNTLIDSKQYETLLVDLDKDLNSMKKHKKTIQFSSQLLKDDGIKSFVIDAYINLINTTINKYLSDMKFNVEVELDSNFNETLKSRFRDSFSYDNFSEGEKARLDLAILLTWKIISQSKNSCASNLLILDEVFDGSLDKDGAEDFLDILNILKESGHIMVISHTNRENLDKFDRVYEARKKGNFSEIHSIG